MNSNHQFGNDGHFGLVCARAQTLETRRQTVKQALNIEEQTLDTKLQRALYKMKNEKPELFNITLEDQIAKMTAELAMTFLKLIVS